MQLQGPQDASRARFHRHRHAASETPQADGHMEAIETLTQGALLALDTLAGLFAEWLF